MKKNLIYNALLSVMICLGAIAVYDYFEDKNQKIIKIEHVNNPIGKKTLYSKDDAGNITPLDFRTTANAVLEGVVHIKSTHLNSGNSPSDEFRNFPSPFRDFFGDEFGKFFQPNYKYESPRSHRNKSPLRVGSGSGVIISEDGYIVTNNHVIADADDIEVTLHDNRSFKARIIGTDPSTDLALLQIKSDDLRTIPLTDSDDVDIGQWVLAIGNPMGLNSTVTAGIISAKGRNININREKYAVENFLQTDAAINPGNSGGALVNLNGGLVGINTAIASPTGSFAGYGFAVPANIVKKVVEDLLQYGMVQRGVLGVMIRTVDGNFAKEKDLHIVQGVYVDSLLEKSAAGKAGVAAGDVITSVNDLRIKTSPELQGVIAQYRPGEEVQLGIMRGEEAMTINVVLNNPEGNTALASKDSREIMKVLGADIQNLEKQVIKDLGIQGGVKVTKLYPGKLKKHTQMREGFIITKINGELIKDVDDLINKLENKDGGVMLEGIYEDIPGTYYYAIGLNT